MDSMEVSATCRWGGRCHRETEHLVTHPIIGLVEVCGPCHDHFHLSENVVADVEGGEDPTITVLDEVRFARYFERGHRVRAFGQRFTR